MQQEDLDKIVKRKGYGIIGTLGKGSATFGIPKGSIRSQIGDTGEVSDVERSSGHESICEKGASLAYTGLVRISIKVFRRRLSDPLGDAHKWHIDFLRYCGALKDDSDDEIRLTEEPHEKVETVAEERVEITLTYEAIAFDPKYGKVNP